MSYNYLSVSNIIKQSDFNGEFKNLLTGLVLHKIDKEIIKRITKDYFIIGLDSSGDDWFYDEETSLKYKYRITYKGKEFNEEVFTFYFSEKIHSVSDEELPGEPQ
jgi:hypothetical protein